MAGKEVDSNFFIFLPHVFTSDPVSDIDKGPRYSCFIGELLSFFLIAQFRGKNRNEIELREWQKRLLRFLTSVSVSCTDLATRKEEDINKSGYITCWPLNSSRSGNQDGDYNFKVPEPTVTNRGDVIYPLHVCLSGLSALTKKVRLSVNVWTPELNATDNENVLDKFLSNDPENFFTELQSSFRCHVNASLPVVVPPTVRCKYTQVCGRHYLCVEVMNSLSEKMTIHQVNVHPGSHMEPGQKSSNHNNSFHNWSRKQQQRTSGLMDVVPIAANGHKANSSKITLLPWEHHTFVFRILYHENHSLHSKCLEVALTTSLRWSVDTLQLRNQKLTTAYWMPVFNIRRSSLIVRASCPSSVCKGKRFQVKYTITNTERDDRNVQLVWRPDYDNQLVSGVHNLSAESLVCLQPTTRIGLESLWYRDGVIENQEMNPIVFLNKTQDNSPRFHIPVKCLSLGRTHSCRMQVTVSIILLDHGQSLSVPQNESRKHKNGARSSERVSKRLLAGKIAASPLDFCVSSTDECELERECSHSMN